MRWYFPPLSLWQSFFRAKNDIRNQEMKRKTNTQVMAEKDQLKDIAWAKKQKKNKEVKRTKRSSQAQICPQK